MDERYVTQDQAGVLRVGNSHVMLDSVLAAFLEGHSAETIQSLYPTLSLESVYGAIAHYLGHRQEIDGYLNQQDATWAKWREQAERNAAPVVRRLRALRGSHDAEIA
jgi:uncharacterized protein (DUF433 family)